MRGLSGKTVFLTAAGAGIGKATALRLAQEGMQVWISDRDARALDEVVQEAGRMKLQVSAIQADSGQEAEIAQAIQRAFDATGRLDVLVNNAGGSLHTPYRFAEETDEDWQRVMGLNLMGAVWACRAALPLMQRVGSGRIINYGSKAGRYGSLIAGPNYAAAKGAISALTRQLAMEYGPEGITVNCICPGVVLTPRTSGLWAERRSAAERDQIVSEIPLRRHAGVDDIAGIVAFLASDDAAFITGVSLDVNGGQAMA
ncbi:SDR family NAD(P)-dependent oxidoreductase [Allopusillimonas ginsengisoli]|uniref:SDR family NAD(P)-dependent oxidoreductase n=1 Tax=Allopusillimonas ginsengisoli TaxID=453575 RepID=UPI0010227258|nr:SDR family NAD(P)-dependent oxidoreductase [Allopusillimonas ginsengisoli]TEA78781.1 SDR family oxidoreductase [Allopusillimonas ginsengisoli]